MSSMLPALDDYATSRLAFLAAAAAVGAAIEQHAHPLRGPDGTELATDVARLGAPRGEATKVVVVASGTHGVEGHAGSGLQRLLLGDPRVASLDRHTAVLLIHAVNPYGMAWSRRVDANNIDVNRNFVDFDEPLPASPLYSRIDSILNPATDTYDPDDASWLDELLAFGAEVGMNEGFQAVSGGQYDHPHGMQFGGTQPSWSRCTLEAIWARHLLDAEVVVNIDVHTGLGPTGVLTMFQTADAAEPAAELGRSWYPNVLRAERSAGDTALQRGLLGPGLDAALGASTTSVPVVAEFGTRDELTVLAAMRADNWLHHHGERTSELGELIRARTREAFFVDDEHWRMQLAQDGLDVVHRALDGVSSFSASSSAS